MVRRGGFRSEPSRRAMPDAPKCRRIGTTLINVFVAVGAIGVAIAVAEIGLWIE